MIRSKSSGFSLLETIVALAVMGLVLAPLFLAESTMFQSIRTRSAHMERMIAAKTYAIEMRRAVPHDATTFNQEKKITRPATTLKYEWKAVGEQTVFKGLPNLFKEQVTFEWEDRRQKRSDVLVNYVYRSKG
jgi:prepilin-type N-terminal cleavage/methylation domain-containing protein